MLYLRAVIAGRQESKDEAVLKLQSHANFESANLVCFSVTIEHRMVISSYE